MKISLVVLKVNQIKILRFPKQYMTKFLFQTSILWLPLLTIQALWIGVITGLLSRAYTLLYLYFCNDKSVFNDEENYVNKSTSYIIHSFFTAKFKFFLRSTKYFHGLQGGFVISEIVFGCDNPTYNPSFLWELWLLTQCSGITTLQSLILEKQCRGAWPSMVLSMKIDKLTYNPSPSNS